MRFLFPVYLIDSVEVSTWDATAGNTLEKSEPPIKLAQLIS